MGRDTLGVIMQTKEEVAARQKVYYKANKEEYLARQKSYHEANREERLAYSKAYYEANKEEILAKNKPYLKAYREANKKEIAAKMKLYHKALRDERNLILFQYKGSKCQHCALSEPDHLEVYDYHHVDPTTKLHNIGTILEGPLERLMTEVDKCLLLCGNCHRKEHARLNKKEEDNE